MKNIYTFLIGITFLISSNTIAQLSITNFDPANNATNVSKDITTFILTFNQNIKFNSSGVYNIKIKKYSDDSDIGSYLLYNGTAYGGISTSGDQFIIDDANLSFDYNTKYYIVIDADAIQSSDGTYNFSGLAKDDWVFTIESQPVPPVISTYDPTQAATDVPINKTLNLTFDKKIEFNPSTTIYQVKIYDSNDNLFEKYDIQSGSADPELSLSNDSLSLIIDPTANFDTLTTYYVLIDSAAVQAKDDGAAFGGISSSSDWSFTTAPAPKVSTYDPTPGANDVPIDKTLILTFDQNMQFNPSGTYYIRINDSGNNTFESFGITDGTPDAGLSISGPQLSINPTGTLSGNTTYYVLIDANAVQASDDGANFKGISSSTEWSFTTPPPPSITGYLPLDGDTMVRVNDTLVLTFNENIALGSAGYVNIYNSNGTQFESLGTSSTYISVSNNNLYISHSAAFAQDSSYYVLMDNGFVKSLSTSIDFPGITDSTQWTFKAIKVRNWLGSNSTSWTDSGNWDSNGVFVDGAVVNIPASASFNPVISSGNVKIADLIIEAGGGLSINNGATVTIDSIIELKSNTTANAYLLCNGTLNYKSNNTRIHQNIASPDRWYYVSSPVTGATKSSIDCTGDMYYWDNAEGVWRTMSATTPMDIGKGYVLKSNNDLIFSGPININDVDITLDYGKSVGWNLIGNPFTNSINWNNVTLADSVFNGFWLYQNIDTIYGTYNGTTKTQLNLALDSIIPPNHNFWVRLDTTISQTISFTSACKTTTTGTYLKNIQTSVFPTFKFSVSNGPYSDEVAISFSDDGTPLNKFNMTKKFSSSPKYVQPYFSSNNTKLCMIGKKAFKSEVTIPFSLRIVNNSGSAKTYTINTLMAENFPDNIVILLEDLVENKTIDILNDHSYTFTESRTGDITDRFQLTFKGDISTSIKENPSTNEDNNIKVWSIDKNIIVDFNDIRKNVTVDIFNTSGQLINKQTNVQAKRTIPILKPGVYIVRISDNSSVTTKKVFVK